MYTAPIITQDLERNFRAARRGDPLSMTDLQMASRSVMPSDDLLDRYAMEAMRSNYPPSVMSETGNTITKKASSGIIYTQPQFFSPIHTPINWQIPSKRKEQYQWARYYYENEPKVATAVEFYSRFPVNNFEHVCKNRYVKKYFDGIAKTLKLVKWLRIISHETHLLGDCFPFLEVDCELCNGTGVHGGRPCSHEGGSFKRMVILNPEYVEVYSDPMSPDSMIAFIPSEELRNLIIKRGPGHEKFSNEIRGMIATGSPIPLDNRNVSHIKYCDNGYNRYGVGMIRRLFPVLAYKTKLMTAQWIVSERLILPIKVVKVGSDERPASPQDLANVQSQMAQVANDPNLTLVTHHAFELDWFGAAGKVLQLTGEFEIINQEILDGLAINKALLNGEGPCFHPSVEILTEEGWRHYEDVADGEKLATFNKNTGALEFQHFNNRIVRNWDGDLVQFKTDKIDMLPTTNHRMLVQDRMLNNGEEAYSDWKVVPAEEVKYNSRMRACVDSWQGQLPEEYMGVKTNFLMTIGYDVIRDLDAFVGVLGYYISEGWINENQADIIRITNSATIDKISDCLTKSGINFNSTVAKDAEIGDMTLFQMDKDTSAWFRHNTSGKARQKRIPKWVRNLPTKQLDILLEALIDGNDPAYIRSLGSSSRIYVTSFKDLANDVMEVAFKLGYAAWIGYVREDEMYVVHIPSSDVSKFPVIDTLMFGEDTEDRAKCITRQAYKGKVWCFEVPNEFLVVRMNGKPLICGNTYSNAAIGVEVMIDKLETWREELSDWVEQRIYLPIAMMKGFVEKNEWGEYEYVYPKLKWDIMHLRDQQQYRTFVLQLHEKGVISTQRLLESFDIDYDEEVELLRWERTQGAIGGGPQPGGELGGGFGGMPGGGGGGGGGMPDLGGLGEGMGGPAGQAGAELGGAMGGGGAPGGGAMASNSVANIREFGGRILKQRTREKIVKQRTKSVKVQGDQDENSGFMRDKQGRIMMTSIERELLKNIADSVRRGELRYSVIPQFPVEFAGQEYSIDFAMPQIKLGVEVDGALYHSTDEQQQEDRARDNKLEQVGWTIIRFTDKEVETKTRQIMDTIIKHVVRKENWLKRKEA